MIMSLQHFKLDTFVIPCFLEFGDEVGCGFDDLVWWVVFSDDGEDFGEEGLGEGGVCLCELLWEVSRSQSG